MVPHRQNIGTLTTSRTLRPDGAQAWMKEIRPVEQLLDKLFASISPKLHHAVSKAMLRVRWDKLSIGSSSWSEDRIVETARSWPGATPGITVISNRATICHLDVNGHKMWYDILVAAGTYTACQFRVVDLNLEIKYLPRTVIALNGGLFRHEVIKWEGGDRVCYAHWVRPTLLQALSVPFPLWVTQAEFLHMLSP